MKEVATYKVFGIYLLTLDQKKIPRSELVKGFPITLNELYDKKHRMDWGLFVALTKRLAKLVGGGEALVNTGFLPPIAKPAKVIGSILSLFREPKSLYAAMVKMGGPAFFSNIDFAFTETGSNSLRIDITIPEQYEDCPEFFSVYKGIYTCLPTTINLLYAIVEMEVFPRHAVYNVMLPPSMTLLTRTQVALNAFRGAKGIVEELGSYQREIRGSYGRLEKANRKLHEQEIKFNLLERVSNISRLATVDRLAGGVGHEINNPLMIMLLNTDLLIEMVDDANCDRNVMLERLLRMRDANLRIANIVSALKDIGTCDPNEPEKTVPLLQILEKANNICLSHFNDNGVKLEIGHFDPELSVRAHSSMLSHALLYLLHNAFDAVMEMDERWIRIDIQEEQHSVTLQIMDSGPGISPAVIKEMFVPFFTTKKVGKGAGLGLSLAKKYVEIHGSSLVYDEESGHTRFSFTLAKESPHKKAASGGRTLRRRKLPAPRSRRMNAIAPCAAIACLLVSGCAWGEGLKGAHVKKSSEQQEDRIAESCQRKEALRTKLSEKQYAVVCENGTEPPFANEYWNNKRAGIYVDVISGEPLFSSRDKFESGTGWPSFTKPIAQEHVVTRIDRSHGMVRTEVRSKKSDGHLGHVFEDGPGPDGLRYCINSAALRFIPIEDLERDGYGSWLPLFEEESDKPKEHGSKR